MLSKLATASAGPCPVWTLARQQHRPHAGMRVDTHRTRRYCTASPQHRDRLATRLVVEGPVPRRHRALARRLEPRRDTGEHQRHHLPTRVDEDDPAADLVHECAETETDA